MNRATERAYRMVLGATIKRLADSAVLHGTDVENATDLIKKKILRRR